MKGKKLYENSYFVIGIKIISVLIILFLSLDMVFKVMLLFGYLMLFWQERWHKHLLIMLVMLSLLFIASNMK